MLYCFESFRSTLLPNDTIAVAGWFSSNSQNRWHWLSEDVEDFLAIKANIRLKII
jgi:hypothetical protein